MWAASKCSYGSILNYSMSLHLAETVFSTRTGACSTTTTARCVHSSLKGRFRTGWSSTNFFSKDRQKLQPKVFSACRAEFSTDLKLYWWLVTLSSFHGPGIINGQSVRRLKQWAHFSVCLALQAPELVDASHPHHRLGTVLWGLEDT